MLCVHFIYERPDLRFKIDYERQIFDELFHGNLIYSQSCCRKSAERKLLKRYFIYFVLLRMCAFWFESWPTSVVNILPNRLPRQNWITVRYYVEPYPLSSHLRNYAFELGIFFFFFFFVFFFFCRKYEPLNWMLLVLYNPSCSCSSVFQLYSNGPNTVGSRCYKFFFYLLFI